MFSKIYVRSLMSANYFVYYALYCDKKNCENNICQDTMIHQWDLNIRAYVVRISKYHRENWWRHILLNVQLKLGLWRQTQIGILFFLNNTVEFDLTEFRIHRYVPSVVSHSKFKKRIRRNLTPDPTSNTINWSKTRSGGCKRKKLTKPWKVHTEGT